MCTKVAVSSVIDGGRKLVEVEVWYLTPLTWWYLKGMLAHVSTDGCASLSVVSILTRPFTILYIKTSLALCLLSSNVGHFSSLSMLVQLYRGDQFYWWRKPEDPGENHRPVARHWQTLSHNVGHLALIGIRTHNISGDRHWLHRYYCHFGAHANFKLNF
jgi:hypothetical protein